MCPFLLFFFVFTILPQASLSCSEYLLLFLCKMATMQTKVSKGVKNVKTINYTKHSKPKCHIQHLNKIHYNYSWNMRFFWLVIWNLLALYLIKTKKLFILDGGVPTLLVPANRTRIFCNGEAFATHNRSNIAGITYSGTTAEVFFGNGNGERFVCE